MRKNHNPFETDMRIVINIAWFLVLFVTHAVSQTTTTPGSSAFEVASIRPNPGPWREIQGFYSSGPTLRLIAWDIKSLIMEAYNLMEHEVVCPSTTLNPERYDIVAKAEGDIKRTRPEFRQILQTLLADRFQLRFHREIRELPVYFMVVGKNGPAFRETPAEATRRTMHGVEGRKQTLDLSFATMESLAKEMNSYYSVNRPVLDKTGLTGLYDIKLAATPEFRLGDGGEPGDIDIFGAVQTQLGLKLESRKANIQVIVTDHIEKPSAN